MPELRQQAVDRASAVLERHRDDLMTRAGVLGVGGSGKNNAEAAVVIYVDKTAGARPQLPGNLVGCACGSS